MSDIFLEMGFWHWMILGVALLVFELMSGSGFLLWIAIGSFITSIFMLFAPAIDWPWALLLFSTFSVITCLLWWRYLKSCTERSDKPTLNRRTDNFIGRIFDLETPIENGRGKIRIGDTFWVVEGNDQEENTKVRVVSVDGVLLHVESTGLDMPKETNPLNPDEQDV